MYAICANFQNTGHHGFVITEDESDDIRTFQYEQEAYEFAKEHLMYGYIVFKVSESWLPKN